MNNIFGQYVLNHFKQLEFSNSAQLLAFSLAGAGQVASSENLMKGSEIDSYLLGACPFRTGIELRKNEIDMMPETKVWDITISAELGTAFETFWQSF